MMLHIQSAQQKSVRRWDSVDMTHRFNTALEASKIVDELNGQLRSMNYNRDLHKYLKNVEGLVSTLSSAEVKARQSHKPSLLDRPREDLASAIDYLEKMIIIAKLSE